MKKFKVYREKINGDLDTPISIYGKYVKEEKGILFESRDKEKGRYTLIAKKPYKELKKQNGEYFEDETPLEVDENKFLKLVEERLKEIKVDEDEKSFIGGAYGTIGYEVIREYENLPNVNEDDMELPDAHLMFFDRGIVYDHKYTNIILTCLEEDSEEGRARAEKILNKIKNELTEKVNYSLEVNEIKTGEIIRNTTKKEFEEMVEKAKKYIFEGDIFQVVLSQRWHTKFSGKSFELYRKLRNINPSPYLFYINFGGYQVVGSSPEMLVEKTDKKIYTCPIAGTRKRGSNKAEDLALAENLLNDPKERAEHIMLIDLARNDVGRVSEIGTVEVEKYMEVENFSHVMHLVSLVTGTPKTDENSFSILPSIMPAGTLSGAPKIRAMEIIDELEKNKRGVYGGAVGYFSFNGNMDMCIAIRTMVVADEKVYMQAGAGITSDSVPENEYYECENKVKALIKSLESA